jgi:hypothetical protein
MILILPEGSCLGLVARHSLPVYYRASVDLYQIQVMPPRLELRGFELCIISLRHPYDPDTHPIHAEIEAPVYYLPEYVHDDIPRVLRACLWVCWKPACGSAGNPGSGVPWQPCCEISGVIPRVTGCDGLSRRW